MTTPPGYRLLLQIFDVDTLEEAKERILATFGPQKSLLAVYRGGRECWQVFLPLTEEWVNNKSWL